MKNGEFLSRPEVSDPGFTTLMMKYRLINRSQSFQEVPWGGIFICGEPLPLAWMLKRGRGAPMVGRWADECVVVYYTDGSSRLHEAGFRAMPQRVVTSSWLAFSICPMDWGWYPDYRLQKEPRERKSSRPWSRIGVLGPTQCPQRSQGSLYYLHTGVARSQSPPRSDSKAILGSGAQMPLSLQP